MLRIDVDQVDEGLHPSEKVVTFQTADGEREEIAVDQSFVDGLSLSVYPIERVSDRLLVELPRETARGQWRVWISNSAVLEQ
jgi:hypothetical protein